MMISPSWFVRELKDADYVELIKARDRLIREIRRFEKKEAAGDRTGEERGIDPSPDVIYQMNLDYLSELCKFMSEKYNRDNYH